MKKIQFWFDFQHLTMDSPCWVRSSPIGQHKFSSYKTKFPMILWSYPLGEFTRDSPVWCRSRPICRQLIPVSSKKITAMSIPCITYLALCFLILTLPWDHAGLWTINYFCNLTPANTQKVMSTTKYLNTTFTVMQQTILVDYSSS